ncbi:MAG: hypothetical protein EOO44_17620 [Flavobacterium sp.]|nr:MAG: hypothetical protein EOO44_17620 [Flavobacterium sp.]
MKLTAEQKLEVRNYIIDVPKYRETYNELYDHIINALEENNNPFSINEVASIVNTDLGGFSEVVAQEKNYQKTLNRKFIRSFQLEMLNTFKWPNMLGNIIVLTQCIMLYYAGKSDSLNFKVIIWASFACCMSVTIFANAKIFINIYRYRKYSILDSYLSNQGFFALIITSGFIQFFLSKESIVSTSYETKLAITLMLFFFTSVYVRSFIKFYRMKFGILTV